MEQITISNIKIDVVRKDIKNIHLAVYPPTGRVRIAAPLRVNEDAIRLFTISKLGWIKRHQRKFEGQERIPPREYKNRESHYFQGRRYLLNIIEADAPPKVVLKNKTYIDLYLRPKTPIAKRHEIMKEWYRKELKKIIPNKKPKSPMRFIIKAFFAALLNAVFLNQKPINKYETTPTASQPKNSCKKLLDITNISIEKVNKEM